ncbi:hypothetical protein QJS04_geneDACA015944 [Acorus gramineus]|uniref:Uncharacterized protein n=1 Tax=Acorus gramineus TaxID=55184 RepID=A0AAV9BG64_ACOGR|nr:hypothetical protein QJS04_geneDACA015944 [Acorus gramineus]
MATTTNPSHRSSSPLLSRTNSNSRTPEANIGVRKLFSGNPIVSKSFITPVSKSFSSPTDLSNKNLGSKGGVRSSRDSMDQKENSERDLKAMRARSSVLSNGSKHFMAPTISASSKVSTASPRKKILSERNDGPNDIRSSFTGSEGGFDSQVLSQTQKSQETPKPGEGLDFLEPSSNPVSRNGDSNPIPFSSSHLPSISPLDADPSLRPYDPKTNFLSPRPRFLHYKPNPRVELRLNRGDEFNRRLEESLTSESCSEQSEETQSSDSVKGVEDGSTSEVETESRPQSESEMTSEETQSYGPMKGVDDGSTFEVETESGSEVEPMIFRRDERPKSCFHLRSKFPKLALILAIACLLISVTDCPVFPSPSVLTPYKSSFSDFVGPRFSHSLVRFSEFASTHLEGFGRSFGHWYYSVISVPREGKTDSFGFINSTAMVEESLRQDGANWGGEWEEEEGEEEQMGSVTLMESAIEEVGVEEAASEFIRNEGSVETVSEQKQNECDVEAKKVILDDSADAETVAFDDTETNSANEEKIWEISSEQVKEVNNGGVSELVPDMDINGDSSGITISGEEQNDHGLEPELSAHEVKQEEIHSEFDMGITDKESSEELGVLGEREMFPKEMVLGIFSVVLTMAVSFASLYFKRKEMPTSMDDTDMKQAVLTEKMVTASVSASTDSKAKRSVRRNSVIDVETIGESGPSEASSSLRPDNSSSSRQRSMRMKDEMPSNERLLRRESVVTSPSISYGSFTTYEKITKQVRALEMTK